MSFPPNYLRLTPDAKNRSVSTPSGTTTKTPDSAKSTGTTKSTNTTSTPKSAQTKTTTDATQATSDIPLPAQIESYMTLKQEDVASHVQQRVDSALAELTKQHKEVEKKYIAKIKHLEERLAAIEGLVKEYTERDCLEEVEELERLLAAREG